MLRRREVLSDGCLQQTWKFLDHGTTHTRGKRRPLQFQGKPKECSWHINVHCADHPNR